MEQVQADQKKFWHALVEIDRIQASEIFQTYYEANRIQELEWLISDTLRQIGDSWQQGDLSLAQVYMSGTICEALVEQYLSDQPIKYPSLPRMGIAVLQDQHVLGKRIFSSILRAHGIKLIDLGEGLSPETIVQITMDQEVKVLLISTLMLHSAMKVKKVIALFEAHNYSVQVFAGGAPFRLDDTLWQEVGLKYSYSTATEFVKAIKSGVLG